MTASDAGNGDHPPIASGVRLADLSWQEAAEALNPDTLVVIPLGAAAKEHGPHLRLDNDLRLADALVDHVIERCPAVFAPTVPYHHYPAFTEYPGSVSLRFATARDLIVDVVNSLAAYGPRRFYVLNTGVSTVEPLRAAAELLQESRIILRFTDIVTVAADVEHQIARQRRGSHADEIETSLMLYLAPDRVDMARAVKDDLPRTDQGGFTRKAGHVGIYSPSGVWGDPTLASREKGRRVAEAIIDGIIDDVARLRRLPSTT